MKSTPNSPTKPKALPLLLLLLLCGALLLSACEPIILGAPSPSPTATPTPSYPKIFSGDLARAYLADEETAREMYTHTMLSVRGKVLRIEQMTEDTVVVVLDGFVTKIQCTVYRYDYPEDFGRLAYERGFDGHNLEVTGVCNGLADGIIQMDGCFVSKWPTLYDSFTPATRYIA